MLNENGIELKNRNLHFVGMWRANYTHVRNFKPLDSSVRICRRDKDSKYLFEMLKIRFQRKFFNFFHHFRIVIMITITSS